MSNGQFEQALQQVLSRQFPEFQRIEKCRQLTAGASQETYKIDCAGTNGEFTLALRRAQPTSLSESTLGNISLADEARLFNVATKNNIPSPKVLYELNTEDKLGPGFFMNWLDGETMGHKINRAPELADIRPKLARQCGEILGQIHTIDWQTEGLDTFLDTADTASIINATWDKYKALNVPVPMFDYTARWLLDNIPKTERLCLVHSDFRNGNLMVDPNGVNAVLDWELAHIGDPIQDIGYLTCNSWRFGQADFPVGGFGTIEDFLAGYQSVTGIEVANKDIVFWRVFGSFWWGVSTLTMAHTWRTGETPSLERPVIGRRSSEAQMDCINLIFPGDFTLPEVQADLAQGTMLPMPAELLAGPIALLKERVATQLDPHASFLAKVAANAISIAQRELLYGGTAMAEETERLRAITGIEGSLDELRWTLVKALQQGMDVDTPKLQTHLRQTVATQLFIDQPKYSALQHR